MSYGEEIGFHMVTVDIGGGFAGHTHLQCNVKELSVSVNKAVDDITRKHPNLKVFAEPGNSYCVYKVGCCSCVNSYCSSRIINYYQPIGPLNHL